MLREFSLLSEDGSTDCTAHVASDSFGDGALPSVSLLGLLDDPSAGNSSVELASAAAQGLHTDVFQVDMLGPNVKWVTAGELACCLIRMKKNGTVLQSEDIREVYLEGPTRVRCTLCSTKHAGVLAAWYLPVRAGRYSLVMSLTESYNTDAVVAPVEFISTKHSVCVVPGLPDANSMQVFAPKTMFCTSALSCRVDCRDSCGNVRMNPLDGLLVRLSMSAKLLDVTCRIRADVGILGVEASSSFCETMERPKAVDMNQLNLTLGMVNGTDKRYTIDMQSATAPDGTFIDPPPWLVWRCFVGGDRLLVGQWSLHCRTQSGHRSVK